VKFLEFIVAVPSAIFWWSLFPLVYVWKLCGQLFMGKADESVR
jgi:hypothetical protein